jgi:hypothetical protein
MVGLALMIVAAAPAHPQTTATVTGTVSDTSGGALPGTRLTLQHTETGLIRTALSGPDGRFAFAGLPVGNYSLSAELAGFRTVVRQGLLLTIGQTVTLPVELDVVVLETIVDVIGGAAFVNTATSELSFLVGQQEIESLPLNGRNYTDLALLQPGRGDARAEVRLEVFNVFNRANFANPTLIAFAGATAAEAPLATFGRIRATVTSARQMQLGVRVTF